ncbi:tetratricopeptide repeat protein [Actinomadura macra]|uniref:tetratricopeptide repeat protein n=1 Tax=Actinomadura macra TaxID=46164 RepID=UPI0008301FAD|nr:tetratricopeptide repeat protein [Actinomadura macra]
MSASEVRLSPIVTWPERVEAGGSYLVSVDVELEGALDAWPYPREEYAIGCMLDGGSGFAVESVGDTTLVVHRFGGTYGPVTFVAHALDAPSGELHLTLLTEGGVPFRTIPLAVDHPVPLPLGDPVPAQPLAGPRRRYSITPFPPPELADTGSLRDLLPSRVLAKAGKRAPFLGRTPELERLRTWLDGAGARILLLHGPGGQGKSRLAAELARYGRSAGWEVMAAHLDGGHLAPDSAASAAGPPAGSSAAGPAKHGLLLVVDYTETWPTDDLLMMLDDVALQRTTPVRVLLVARPAGAWWLALADRLGDSRVETGAMPLGPLADDDATRDAAFTSAVERFARLYGRKPDSTLMTPPAGLHYDPGFGQVLNIHMAALSAVLGVHEAGDHRGVATVLVGAERSHWASLREREVITTSVEAMTRVTWVAALFGPVPEDECEGLLRAAGITDDLSEAVRDHAYCYPPPAPGMALQPISPDALREDFVAVHLPTDHSTPEEWVHAGLLATPRGPSALAVLVETARRWPAMAQRLNAILLDDPAPAIDAGGAVLLRLAELDGVDPDVLETIDRRLPDERRIDLDIARAVLGERLFLSRLARTKGDTARQGRLYMELSGLRSNVGMYEQAEEAAATAIALRRAMVDAQRGDIVAAGALGDSLTVSSRHLGRLGRHEQGLQRLTESVDVMRRLAAEHPVIFESQLVSTLNAQSLALADLGRREESLAVVQEAVALYRRQSDADPPTLAGLLNNLSARLSDMGRSAEGLAAAEEAVALYQAQPESHLPSLAAGLHNHSRRLGELGRDAEGAESAAEAVRIQRGLAEANPGAFEAGLAGSLDNLSVRLGNAGRLEEALAAVEEAIRIHRRLADLRPDAYLPDLAAALNNHSLLLGEQERFNEGLAAVEEATDIYRGLAAVNPDAYLPDLAVALSNLSRRLWNLGDGDAGLAMIEEAVALRRRLAAMNAEAFHGDLAETLENLALQLNELGRFDEAVSSGAEAVDILRGNAADRPGLAASLDILATILGQAGRLEEATEVSAETVAINRDLAASEPARYLPDLARSLNNHSVHLAGLGRFEASVEAAREAVEVFRGLAARQPQKFTSGLAKSLVNLSQWGLAFGVVGLAVVSGMEAVRHYRNLNANRPRLHDADLAAALSSLSETLGVLNRTEEAAQSAAEAVTVYRRLAGQNPDALPRLAGTLTALSSHLAALGRREEAVTRSQEAVGLYRRLAGERPRLFRLDLAAALNNHALHLGSLGRSEEGLAAVGEALRIYEENPAERSTTALSNSLKVRDWLRTPYGSD